MAYFHLTCVTCSLISVTVHSGPHASDYFYIPNNIQFLLHFIARCALETVVPSVVGLKQALPLSPHALCVLFSDPPL